MKTLILLALVLGIPVAAMGANPTLTNFNARHFIVDPLALPTNVITLHLNSEQFDTGGSDITITNVFGPGTTNIFQTFITTNITAVTEYVTNLYVTYLVSSNSISGNIQGTPPHLSMFFPDNFSLADSIVTQNADTNGVTVNGTGDGSVTLGGTGQPFIIFGDGGTNILFRSPSPTGSDLVYSNITASAVGVGFNVFGGDNSGARISSRGTFATLEPPATSATTSVQLRDSSSRAVKWVGGRLLPGDVNYSLGGGGNAWAELDLDTRGAYIYGFESGGVNYSRLNITHTGTNAWDTIQFDSQSAGTAGTAPRPFQFTNAPVMLPYVTKAAKTALTAIDGMVVYQTDNTPGLRVYVGGTWYMLPVVADP